MSRLSPVEVSILSETVERLNNVLKTLRVEIAVDDPELNLELDLEEAVTEKIAEVIRRELRMAGLQVNDLDAEPSSNTYASGLRFRWDMHDVPVCRTAEHEVWLRYTSGYSRVTDADAPYILHGFEVVVEAGEDEEGEETARGVMADEISFASISARRP